MREWKVALPKAWAPAVHPQYPLGYRQGVQALLVRIFTTLALCSSLILLARCRAVRTRGCCQARLSTSRLLNAFSRPLCVRPSCPQMAMSADTQAPIGALGRLDWATRAGIAERIAEALAASSYGA